MAVIFAVMAGGQLFGFLGMLIALPVAAVANVLLRFASERYRQSQLYTGEQAAGPVIVVDPQGEGASLQQALQEQAAVRAAEPPAPTPGQGAA
jgi:hypothetical protein